MGRFGFGHGAHGFRPWGVLFWSWGILPPVMGRGEVRHAAATFLSGFVPWRRRTPKGVLPLHPRAAQVYTRERLRCTPLSLLGVHLGAS